MPAPQTSIQARLFALRDEGYRAFHCKLMPTVDPARVIGVRTPQVRKLARALKDTPDAEAFLDALPHQYYEENNLHGFLIEAMADYGALMARLDAFLPHVDNWATCDSIRPRAFKKHLPELYETIPLWLASSHAYTVRFGLGMLMRFYLDEAFCPEVLALAADVRREEYYVNMMVAWFFATALSKRYDAALPYLTGHRLEKWTHNKAIQKALESYRIAPGQKAYLRTLKRQ